MDKRKKIELKKKLLNLKLKDVVKKSVKEKEIKEDKKEDLDKKLVNSDNETKGYEDLNEETSEEIISPVIPISENLPREILPSTQLENTADFVPTQTANTAPQRASYSASEITYAGTKDYSTGTINREGKYEHVESNSSLFLAGENPAMGLLSSQTPSTPFITRDPRTQPMEIQKQDMDRSDLEKFTRQQQKYQTQMEAKRKLHLQHRSGETEIF
jgi:hypothetical protein